jgi:hypothetical protein
VKVLLLHHVEALLSYVAILVVKVLTYQRGTS